MTFDLNRREVSDLPPELDGGVTFHLPMELGALAWAGADPEIVADRTKSRLQEAFRVGMVDPPFYRWALDEYSDIASAIADGNVGSVANAIDPLGAGLAGAAFHGLIRFGYGAMNRDAIEINRGLAYMRARRQLMMPATVFGQRGSMPPPDELAGRTVFDVLGIANTVGSFDPEDVRALDEMLQVALGLVHQCPRSFVAIHAVTSFHALVEVQHALDPDHDLFVRSAAPLPSWWEAYETGLAACSLAVGCEVAPSVPDELAPATNRADAVADALASNDTHSLKLTLSLFRLVEFGFIDDATALKICARNLYD